MTLSSGLLTMATKLTFQYGILVSNEDCSLGCQSCFRHTQWHYSHGEKA